MAVEDLPIFCHYDVQRFTQFGSMDCANWYGVAVEAAKKQQALYPAMGRQHINFAGLNRLVFNGEPRVIFKSINYFYVIVGTQITQYDKFYNERPVGTVSVSGDIWNAVLPVNNLVYVMITDGTSIHVITEDGTAFTYTQITDGNAPTKPAYVAAFGNRFVVSQKDTPTYHLSQINLGGVLDPNLAFTINGAALFNQASGIVRQMCVLHNQLYIFNDFSCDVWANIITQITVAGVTREFPWKLNTSYNFDYGMADPFSLAVDFGRMVWLANNSSGLVSFMASDGSQPKDISSQAVNVLLENSRGDPDSLSPFLESRTDGFIYQYENTIFYRVSADRFFNFGDEQIESSSNSIEHNFETGKWARVIELNGDRNRIQNHVYFNNRHLVTVKSDFAIYEMAGNIYHNELRTPDTDAQATNAFTKYPMRYELVTRPLFLPDYAEFIDDYVEIDFVFGDKTFYKINAPFLNAVYVEAETSTPEVPVYVVDENGAFIVEDGTNYPTFDDNHYYALFKPHIELYYSDDGGMTYRSADVREFSRLGQYRWRMRWYELDVSRNRCYKVIGVSSAPLVILGGVRNTRRASGGAN